MPKDPESRVDLMLRHRTREMLLNHPQAFTQALATFPVVTRDVSYILFQMVAVPFPTDDSHVSVDHLKDLILKQFQECFGIDLFDAIRSAEHTVTLSCQYCERTFKIECMDGMLPRHCPVCSKRSL